MDILIFLIIFSALIGYWANNWGRNGWLWFVVAVLISPLITAVILLIMGRDGTAKEAKDAEAIEAEAQKAAAVEKRKKELLNEEGK
jgi:phosphotransferase system  glucose/maltose/N-acetylglucosamine-specific IIC component